MTGKRQSSNYKTYYQIRKLSDELYKEDKLSVVNLENKIVNLGMNINE